MKKPIKIHQLHDSIISNIVINSTLTSLDVYLKNRDRDVEQNWKIQIEGVLSLSAFSRFTVFRDYVDVYDLVELFDEEWELWRNRIEGMRLDNPSEASVRKLLFASEVFDGGEQGGMVVICRKFSVIRE